MTAPKLLTVAEVADILRRNKRFVLDELRAKNLRGIKAGGWLIDELDLDVYIASKANIRPVQKRGVA